MSKKRNRTKRQTTSRSTDRTASRRTGKRGPNLPSLIFIGVIVLMVVAIAIASALDGDRPACPPGQVWSSSHGHCH